MVMPLSLESVMESVVRVTEQRSRENLEHCLVLTLVQLTGAYSVCIAVPHYFDDQAEPDIECLAKARASEGLLPEGAQCNQHEQSIIQKTLVSAVEESDRLSDGSYVLALPMQDRGQVAATMTVHSPQPMSDFLNVIRGFAAVYRNYLNILKDAERDTLTGLKNRKTFDDKITKIIAHSHNHHAVDHDRRHHKGDEHHWLAIFDIDHFKRINDTYGHVFGDEVLLLFAALMRKVFRTEDLLFRFGGEEFVVVLAPTAADDALAAFDRFRRTVETFPFPQVGQVTVSIGYVRINPEDIPSSVVGQADEALYWAKRHGRNQVCSYDQLLAQGELVSHHNEGDVELF